LGKTTPGSEEGFAGCIDESGGRRHRASKRVFTVVLGADGEVQMIEPNVILGLNRWATASHD
jgi:hypothetical protein